MIRLEQSALVALFAFGGSGCGFFLEGPQPDASVVDERLDAARSLDASMDATVAFDAGRDAPDARMSVEPDAVVALDAVVVPDAFEAPDGYQVPDAPCVMRSELCNDLDDDCDGIADEECVPCEELRFLGGLYLYCRGARTWQGARNFCQSVVNASGETFDLVSLETPAERTALTAAVLLRSPPMLGAWIGLRQPMGGTMAFRWVRDESSVPDSDLRWVPGEPNNGGADGGEDCVHAYPSGFWNDTLCSADYIESFVCERQ